LKNQGLRLMFREGFWKGVIPMPVGPQSSLIEMAEYPVYAGRYFRVPVTHQVAWYKATFICML
jgi:hypothetical protein